jgi:glutathione S-transferase
MIIVHHLNHSRSTRVLWLLEELQLDYEVVRHERLPGFRAPGSLRNVHASGKAPVVELDGLVLAESAAILKAINHRYGQGRLAPEIGSDMELYHEEWLHFSEGSLAHPLMMTLYGRLAGGMSDLLGRVICGNAKTHLDRLEVGLGKGPFILGAVFSLADIQLSYLVDLARYLGLLEDRPSLLAYLASFESRPAFVRALAVGGAMMPPS